MYMYIYVSFIYISMVVRIEKKYKNDFPRKFQSVQYSIKDIPNRQIEKYVPYKRSQISKNCILTLYMRF